MTMLHALKGRCALSFKMHSAFLSNEYLKSHYFECSPKAETFYLTSQRHFSWEGVYSSVALSTPVLTAQDLLLSFHASSGLPWWAVIGLSTFAIRTFVVFPFAVHQSQVIARMMNLKEELNRMAPELTKEVNIAAKMYGWNENTCRKVFRKNMKDYYKKFIIRDNCHPFKIVLLTFFQVPAWICFSFALRNITMWSLENQALEQSLKTEGILWFTDLTSPDLVFIPVLLSAVNLLIVEVTALKQINKGSKLQTIMTNISRGIILMVGYAATLNPTSVTFYWLCSSMIGAAQNILFLSPAFRRALRIPKTSIESNNPYRDLVSNFKKRFKI